jgi:hypothetical protein
MTKANIAIVAAICAITVQPASARSTPSMYDGPWHLAFTTRAGSCDPTYNFDVNISNGVITHPNLVKFRGRVAPNGAVRASVTVQDKFASGSGQLSAGNGGGTWNGHTGSARCSGYWTATKS